MRRSVVSLLLVALTAHFSGPVPARAQKPRDLTEASLQELMSLKVTSVSKRERLLSRSAAAVHVITHEDIRRSGATTIPDLLRMVPGVNVARLTANTWAISIRGFNTQYSSKVLVLIDGRTVYNSIFSGVYWDQQSVPLENIERIEVIRGPGGTMWGANAVNGIINIITKPAKETQGGLARTGGGSNEASGLAQYGGATRNGAYRVFTQHVRTGRSPRDDGSPGHDSWHRSQAGFRADWNPTDRDTFTAQGDLFGASEGQTITTPFFNRPGNFTFDDKVRVSSGNLLGRWTHTARSGGETAVQAYYDRFRRVDQALIVVNTADVDVQHHFQVGSRHDLMAGAAFRINRQTFQDGYSIAVGTGHRQDHLYSAMAQDEVHLSPSLSLMIGSKFERNSYTGFEYEPSAQIVWAPNSRRSIWASAARAIEQPSWAFSETYADGQTFPVEGAAYGVMRLLGNPKRPATRMFNYEAGYRAQPSRRLTLDVAGFVSDYRFLRTLEPRPPKFVAAPSPYLVVPYVWDTLGRGLTSGIELSAKVDVTSRWRLDTGYSFLQMKLRQDAASGATDFEATTAGNSPRHQAQARSHLNLSRALEWDASAAYVSALRTGPVPGYVRVDSQLSWRRWETVELSLTGQNLLQPRHLEFGDRLRVLPTYAERSVFAKVTWRF